MPESCCFWTMVLKKTLENPLDSKEIQLVHPKGNQSWIFIGSWSSSTLATWYELTHWKRPWCWERLKAVGEGDDRGWDGWMASPTQWTWIWASSGSWWWTGKSGVLQRVGHDWATKVNWTELKLGNIPLWNYFIFSYYLQLCPLEFLIPMLKHCILVQACWMVFSN